MMKRANQSEVVVVTGASAGIGRAVVREFAKRKAQIGLAALRRMLPRNKGVIVQVGSAPMIGVAI